MWLIFLLDNLLYFLNFSFETVYEGPSSSYKVGKLQEQTSYSFRIRAANEASYGPYSDIFICQTTVQPPPSVKGNKHCMNYVHTYVTSYLRYSSSYLR